MFFFCSEEFENALNDFCPGRTFQYGDLLSMITDSRLYDDQYEFQLKSDFDNFMGDKLIIGQLSTIKQIIYVQISFHDENGDFVLDDEGTPITYTSSPHELGHILTILHQGFIFSYAKCLLKLQPKSNFDLRSLFFHFTLPLSLTTAQNNKQTTPQSNNQTTPQSNNQTTPQSNKQATPQSNNQTTPQSNNQTTPQSNNQTTPQSNNQTTPQSNNQTTAQSNK
jgi:hypothetical protein